MSLQDIKALDMRDLISLELRGSGKVQQGRCPFPTHPKEQTGKTGAFTYYVATNTFNCWVCRAGGSTIDFWARLHNRDAAWAIRDLAERHNIRMEKWGAEDEARYQGERRREEALAYAADFYHNQFLKAGPVIEYLAKRGLSLDTARRLRLGYANKQLAAAVKGDTSLVDRGLSLADFLMHVDEDGRELSDLTSPYSAKLIAQGPEGRQWDYFRDRLVFPIMRHGRTVHMSARDLSNKEGARKYLNLPHPAQALYLEDNITADLALVFEGLPDTASADEWGFPACGQQGTSGIAKFAGRFKRCRRVIVFFDMDGPGRDSAIKTAIAIHMAMEAGEVLVGSLPEGFKDVNEFKAAGKTRDDFQELVDAARPLLDLMLEAIDVEAGMAKVEVQTNELLRLVAHLGPFHHEAWIGKVRTKLKVPVSTVREAFKRIEAEASRAAAKGEGGGEGGTVMDRIDFTAGAEIVPALDFHFDGAPRGNVTTFMQFQREIEEDGKTKRIKRWEPMTIFTAHTDKGPKVEITPSWDLPLSPNERRRVPSESAVRGRWRIEARFAYSVENYVRGQIAQVSGFQLFDDIVQVLRRYIWLPNNDDHEVIAAWIMMTYVYRLFHAVGYLHLRGVRESGKTNMGFLIEELAFNAKQSASQSESVMFRSVESSCRTMILDEAEKLNSPDPKSTTFQLMLIANAGYKKGGSVERSEPDPVFKGGFIPTAFDVFCPKVFASIADLYYVLASRCIVIECLRATDAELTDADVKDLAQGVHRETANLADLRDRLYCWSQLAFPGIHKNYTEKLVEDKGLAHLRGREREMWLPLLSISATLDEERMAGFTPDQRMAAIKAGLPTGRLLANQRIKEADRRLTESDQSFEVVALTLLYESLRDGEIAPARVDLADDGSSYVLNDLAEHLTAGLQEAGLVRRESGLSAQRLVGLLSKTKAIDAADRGRERFGHKMKRTLTIRMARLESVIKRLGGKVSEAAPL